MVELMNETDFLVLDTLSMDEYQECAMEHCFYPDAVIYPTLGLVSEAGEVADKLKKHFRDGDVEEVACEDGEDELPVELRMTLAHELGDCLFYITAIANDIGYSLEEVAELNLTKLADRSQRGKLTGSGDYR